MEEGTVVSSGNQAAQEEHLCIHEGMGEKVSVADSGRGMGTGVCVWGCVGGDGCGGGCVDVCVRVSVYEQGEGWVLVCVCVCVCVFV